MTREVKVRRNEIFIVLSIVFGVFCLGTVLVLTLFSNGEDENKEETSGLTEEIEEKPRVEEKETVVTTPNEKPNPDNVTLIEDNLEVTRIQAEEINTTLQLIGITSISNLEKEPFGDPNIFKSIGFNFKGAYYNIVLKEDKLLNIRANGTYLYLEYLGGIINTVKGTGLTDKQVQEFYNKANKYAGEHLEYKTEDLKLYKNKDIGVYNNIVTVQGVSTNAISVDGSYNGRSFSVKLDLTTGEPISFRAGQ